MEKLGSAASVSAIVTTLQPPYSDEVQTLWQKFFQDCQVQFVLAKDPIPHFTWQAAESYEEQALDQVIREIARETRPFSVRTSGLGMFTGSMLVVYIAMVKTDALIDLQYRVWEKTQRCAHNVNHNYQPEVWIPHITLAYDPLNYIALECVMKEIAGRRFEWEIPVEQLGVIYAGKGSEFRRGRHYPLGGGPGPA